MLMLAIVIIFFLSFGFALFSLWKELRRVHEKEAQKVSSELAKGRVIFYSPSSSSRED